MTTGIPQTQIQQTKLRQRIVGNAPALNRAIEVALLIAPTDVNVLVIGESGVGKESFPQIIHQNSLRKHGPYVAVNCGAIPEGTIDSELFGHKKGAFTDAVTERKGYFEEADGGTIFLDEVGELPLPTQARLLRVLESGEFMKVGSSQVQRTDIRVVAATNVDLEEAIKKGKFRQDLYYRLNTVTIELPALRDRGEDVLLLFRMFASDFGDKYRMPPVRLSDEAAGLVRSYRWPGNIRELKNLAERLSVIAEDRVISLDMLREQLPPGADRRHPALITPTFSNDGERFGQTQSNNDDASAFGASGGSPDRMSAVLALLRELKMSVGDLSRILLQFMQARNDSTRKTVAMLPENNLVAASAAYEPVTTPASPMTRRPAGNAPSSDEEAVFAELVEEGKVLTLAQMEEKYIDMVMAKNKGSRKKTAEDLDISERTLYRKIK